MKRNRNEKRKKENCSEEKKKCGKANLKYLNNC